LFSFHSFYWTSGNFMGDKVWKETVELY